MKTLTELETAAGFEVLEHLDREVEIPVLNGPQSQGDVRIRPAHATRVTVRGGWTMVKPAGVTVVEGGAGGHPHHLMPSLAGTLQWTTDVSDPEGLAVGVLECTAPAYLLHPEHGGSGIAPGRHVIRRQRQQADVERLVED